MDASERVKKDWGVAVNAICQNGLILRDLTPEYRLNKRLVEIAIEQDGEAFKHSGHYRANKEMFLKAIKTYPRALEDAFTTVTSDRDLVLLALKEDPAVFKYAFYTVRGDFDVALIAVTFFHWNLEHVTCGLNDNEIIVMAALKSKKILSEYTILHASQRLRDDVVFLKKARAEGCEIQDEQIKAAEDKQGVVVLFKG